ncbi:unnamed protein product [Pelagomonas calceolata]|uniref:non-specific serine/threonine protein kinase n=1 Tax=Pelagomonas calceolata TaxID=35677 RepID=A0A7S4ECY9_9STRA|nr:unnamed protein product [Pelagomonas calceolata]|mmetsp:Transcript_12904/g.37664  ORF Transcript_12904/g.37664 Transcript_12904/m.37664 type:complete len:540 (-) Transcript_12904:208-1827(-)
MADALSAAAKARRQRTPQGNAPAPDQVETRSGHLVVRAAAIADPRGVDVSVKPRTLIEQALGCDFVRERFVVGAGAGTGAFSSCFFAEDRLAERDVVLKFTDVRKREHATMCLRETAVLKSISHPAIVGLYSEHTIPCGTHHVAVMEALHGPELNDLIESIGALKESYVRVVARDVASGLGYLHRRGVLHRDVKPDNVICVGSSRTADDRPPTRCVLIDFGLARTLSPADIDAAGLNSEELDKSLSRLAIDMSAVGNRLYSAPETKRAAPKAYPEALAPCTSNYGVAADAYALGKTLAHALTGRVGEPLTGVEQLCGFLCSRGKPKRKTYSSLRDCVSEDCADAVRGLLKARPEERTKLKQFLVSSWVRPTTYDDNMAPASSFHLLECALDLSARRRSKDYDEQNMANMNPSAAYKGRQAPLIELSSSTKPIVSPPDPRMAAAARTPPFERSPQSTPASTPGRNSPSQMDDHLAAVAESPPRRRRPPKVTGSMEMDASQRSGASSRKESPTEIYRTLEDSPTDQTELDRPQRRPSLEMD